MGMAASQARLLSITARVHDVEYKAQHIMSQKVALATQKDDAYQDYMAAYEAKKIQVAVKGELGSETYVDATFASVCEFNKDRLKTYMMTDSASGKMIVSREMYDAYNNFKGAKGGDKYGFALQMLGFSESDIQGENLKNIDINLQSIGILSVDQPKDSHISSIEDPHCIMGQGERSGYYENPSGLYDEYVLMDATEYAVFKDHLEDTKTNSSVMNSLNSILTKLENIEKDGGERSEVMDLIDQFRTKLYDAFASEIYGKYKSELENEPASTSKLKDWDSTMQLQFNYYAQIFEGIENAGGCIPIDEYCKDGEPGNEWFNNMVTSGRVILSEYNTEGTKNGTWSEVSVATSLTLQEVDDTKDQKKAEAKYQHELDVINRKETKFDQELNKLETERTALTKEMDSIKQVKDDNVERTFGIFS